MKRIKSALTASVLAMLLCIAMLMGTTFAWFTDTATTGINRIQTGNLDVALYFSHDLIKWDDAETATSLFDPKALWEPGHTEAVYLKVENAGNLALKYTLGATIASETVGTNVFGEPFTLSDHIRYGIAEGVDTAYNDRATAIAAVSATAQTIKNPVAQQGALEVKDAEKVYAMVVYMPETVGNEANYRGTVTPEISIGIVLNATQKDHESDSFSTDYDASAATPWTGGVDQSWYDATKAHFTLQTAEELAGLAELVDSGNSFEGKTITLNNDINLADREWKPIGNSYTFLGTFNGNNKHISGLKVTTGYKNGNYTGLFRMIGGNAVIQNLTVSGTVSGGNNQAGIAAYMTGGLIENCTSSVTIDSRDKTAGIVCNLKAGTILNCVNNGNINTGSTATNAGVGGIAGYVGDTATIEGCINNGNIGSNTAEYSGGIAGYIQGNVVAEIKNCTNNGSVTAKAAAGGIVGEGKNASVVGCENNASVHADSMGAAGGIVGRNDGGTISNCKNTAAVHGRFAGGVLGVTNKGTIDMCSGGTAAITTNAFELGFSGHTFKLQVPANGGAGRILGANGGGGPVEYTVLKLADNNGDDTALRAVGLCGPYTTWSNLKVSEGSLYGDPLAGNTAYIIIEDTAAWNDHSGKGTYHCGGLTSTSRVDSWTN